MKSIFSVDLKKLIKYESNPQQSTSHDAQNHAQVPLSQNIERLFECHTKTSKLKQREKHQQDPVQSSKGTHKENDKDVDNHRKLARNKSSGEIIVQIKEHASKKKPNEAQNNQPSKKRIPVQRSATENKENVPKSGGSSIQDEVKSKMWIRPKSAQTVRPQISMKKRNDPVALYQEYQSYWEKHKNNICESSRSELRWQIREKMLSNH